MPYDTKDSKDFLQKVFEYESEQRSKMADDLRFSLGEQWTKAAVAQRFPDRPTMVINKIDPRIRQVTNQQRQQRQRLIAHPMDSIGDVKIAEAITGLFRHIEYQSDAETAYDTAFNYTCRIGVGYFRIITDYVRENSFDQEIFIKSIQNPFSVYFDSDSDEPDGSDATEAIITDLIPRDEFKILYPDADMSSFNAGGLDSTGTLFWFDKDFIRIAEHFRIESKKEKLLLLSDGTSHWADELPDNERLQQFGLTVKNERLSHRKTVMWRKITSQDVLEEQVFPGRFIPIIPVYGDQFFVDGKRLRFGMTRQARDPQIAYNFFRTTMIESNAMAPKPKWLMADGQDEDYENEWARANLSPFPVLHYKQTDADGNPAPAPSRIQPEGSPQGATEEAAILSQDLDSVLGVYDPSMRISGPMSGKALNAEQQQAENSNYHYSDNLSRSIKHCGRVILDLIPKIYDTQRVVRIIGSDNKPSLITLNEQNAVGHILNDVTIGQYDITLDVGLGSASKRQEAVTSMMQLIAAEPQLAKIAGDLVVRNMDFPGADIIADRLAASNPMAQLDNKSDIPPQAQMQIKQMQQQLQMMQQQLNAAELELHTRQQMEQYKQTEQTKRVQMQVAQDMQSDVMWSTEEAKQVATVAKIDMEREQLRQEMENHRAEIRAHTELLKARMLKD